MGRAHTSGHSRTGSTTSRKISRRNRMMLASMLAVPAVAALGQSAAFGQVLYWDTNGTTTGAGSPATGTWGSDLFWNDQSDGGGSGTIAGWTDGYQAVFSAGSDATGAYTVTVTGTQTAGGIEAKDGTLTLTGGTILLSSPTVNVTSSGGASIASILDGTTLTKEGTGTLTLTGANTFTGATTINGGVLSINADARLGTAPGSATPSHLTINDATLRATAGFTLNANRGINLGSGTPTIQVTTSTVTYGGIMEGSSLTKTGTGTLSLTGANTYSGGTTVKAGALSIGNATGLGSGSASVESGAALQVTGALSIGNALTIAGTGVSGGGALRKTGSNATTYTGTITVASGGARINSDANTLTLTKAITSASGSALTFGGAGNTTLSGTLSGDGRVTKDGTGTLTLTANNRTNGVFTGGFTVNGGAIAITGTDSSGNWGVIPNPAQADYFILNGGTIRSSTTSNAAGGLVAGNMGIQLGSGGGTLDLTGTGAIVVFTGIVGMTPGTTSATLTKSGPGEFRAAQNWTFTKLNLTGGLYRINGTGGGETGLGAIPTAPLADAITFNGGALGTSVGITLNANRGITVGSAGGNFILSAGISVPSNIVGTGGINLNPTGFGATSASQVLTLSGTNTYGGNTTITTGTLTASGGNAIPDTSQVILPTTGTSTAVFGSSPGSANTETIGSLSGGSASSGSVALNSGTLATGADGLDTTYAGNVTGGGAITKIGTGTFTIIGFDWTATGAVNINAGTIKFGDSNAGFSSSSTVTIASGATLDMNNIGDTLGTIAGAGSIINAGNLTTAANTSATFSGTITGTGSLTKGGTGTLTLTGNNNTAGYTGKIFVNNGKLAFSSDNALGVIPGSATADAITINGGSIGSTASMTLNANRGITLGASGGTLNQTVNTLTIPGEITGAGNLTKTGTGTVALSGTNTYTGTTTVSAGILRYNNAGAIAGAGANVTVAAGATAAAGYAMDQAFLGRIDTASAGTAGLGADSANNLNMSGFATLSLGATGTFTHSGTLTPNGTTYLLGGGGGKLVLANGITDGKDVSVGTSGTVALAATGNKIGALTVGTAKLDLVSNKLVLTNTPEATLRGYLQTGYNAGAWTGNGVISATAAADANKITGIGYLTADDKGLTGGSWDTITGLAATDVITKYTYYGDINLNGTVDRDDFALLDRGYAKYTAGDIAASTAVWLNGDFNYDGAVTAADYLLADKAFGLQGGALSADFLAQREAQFGSDYVAQLLTAVPEPTSLGIVAAGAIGLLGRRRRGR